MAGVNVVKHARDRLELRQPRQVETFFAPYDVEDRHAQAEALVEHLDCPWQRDASPRVEQIFGKVPAVLFDRLPPAEIVQRHGVGDGAVEIEEIRLEFAWWKIESRHCTGNVTEVPAGAAACFRCRPRVRSMRIGSVAPSGAAA